MEGTIKVTPAELTATAATFEKEGGTISTLTREMTSIVTGLTSCWEGEAATAYVSKFQGLEDDIQKLIGMVQEHAKDLTEMARYYSDAEKVNMDEISALLSDVIS